MISPDMQLLLGYDFDKWHGYGVKLPVTIDISPETNSHLCLSGLSGGGKSHAEQQVLARIQLNQQNNDLIGETWLADYKGDDSFFYLRGCPHYRSYEQTLEALDAVYGRLNARLSGDDVSRTPVTLFWDEYVANILALIGKDKKEAAAVMNKVSEILLMGRSMNTRIICTCQRPDAAVFPVGSRLNFGVVIILGAAVPSIYSMLMPDFLDQVKGRKFGRGEGVALLQGSELHYIKVPKINNEEQMRKLCLDALS